MIAQHASAGAAVDRTDRAGEGCDAKTFAWIASAPPFFYETLILKSS